MPFDRNNLEGPNGVGGMDRFSDSPFWATDKPILPPGLEPSVEWPNKLRKWLSNLLGRKRGD